MLARHKNKSQVMTMILNLDKPISLKHATRLQVWFFFVIATRFVISMNDKDKYAKLDSTIF